MATREEELPRSVRKGPLITVKCECGQRRELRYGEQWRCEGCGRRYDTRKIPIEEYAAIRRTQIRYRLFPLLSGILLLVCGDPVLGRKAGHSARWSRSRSCSPPGAVFGRPFYRSRYRQGVEQEHPDVEDQGATSVG